MTEPRHREGAPDRIRNGGARRQPLQRKPTYEVVAECRLAAEQMRAAGDVENNAVGRVEPDQWRIAATPVRDGLEQSGDRLPARRPRP